MSEPTAAVTGPPRFVGRVVVEQAAGWWVLRKALVYRYSRVVALPIRIPAELHTDFASVPCCLWWFAYPADHRHSAASLAHDYLYESHLYDRATADALFHEAMLATGTRPVKAWCMWAAVRLFGGPAYRKGPARQQERRAAWAAQRGMA